MPTAAVRPLAGRRALVTGAARGIGRAIAHRLLLDGARVAIVDLDPRSTRSTAEELVRAASVEIDDAGGGSATPLVEPVVADLGDPEQIGPAVAAAAAALGGLDLVVNNAGVFERAAIEVVTVASWDRVLAVNARAVLLVTQAALPHLRRSGAGRVVNIASMAARKGTPGESVYAASKAAVVALTRIAAQELGPDGITVNAVCPGYVLTELGAATRSAADVAAWERLSPLGRLASPDDVAAAVAFLASDHAAYLTGLALDVTGGMTMA